MTWTKLGDEFTDEAAPLSDAAFRTHVEALCWSNRRLLDLVIPKTALRKFAETIDPAQAVKELVETGWWQDTGDAWWIGVHFAEWQRDRVQVEHLRQRKAQDQRRKRRHDLDDHSLCLPGRCKALSPGESPGESPGDRRGDPGRVGDGDRNGSGSEQHLDVRDARSQAPASFQTSAVEQTDAETVQAFWH
jgi:hypothetical protein